VSRKSRNLTKVLITIGLLAPVALYFINLYSSLNFNFSDASANSKLSQAYPTPEDMQRLQEELVKDVARLQKSKITQIYRENRSRETKQKLASFQNAWLRVNPNIAPFLGKRELTMPMYIYPSNNSDRVCIIQPLYHERERGEVSETGMNFSLGKVENGQLKSDSKEIMILHDAYLGIATVNNGNAKINPLPLPTLLPSFQDAFINDELLRQLQTAGCSDQLPK
jgi:hypothetical protein